MAAPGDRLRVRITEVRRRVLRGAIEAILVPSTHRREPACRHFGACGGCQLQHLSRAAQLQAKSEFVRDCLARIGGIRWEKGIEIESAAEYGWRSRVDLHVRRDGADRPRVGYFRAGSRDLVEIEECPILLPALQAEVAALREPRSRMRPRAGARGDRLTWVADDDGRVVRTGEGEEREGARQRIAGLAYVFGAESFSQVNRPLVGALVEHAVGRDLGESGSGAPSDGKRGNAIDLYSGAGLFALQLARRFAVVHAVESNRSAVRWARENARANGIENVRWSDRAVEAWLASGDAPQRPDLLLLDPPRAGAGAAVVDGISAIRPQALTYISCDPATLARDLRLFGERGYRIESIVALDMFPQSYHVEAVARLAPVPQISPSGTFGSGTP